MQSVYLGGGTSINFDFAALGGSAGSSFNFDNVTVTGTLNHTGRGVNGGDYLTIENGSYVFGNATFTGDQIQSTTATFASNVTFATSSTVNADAVFLDTQVQGNFSFGEVSAQEASFTTSGSTYFGTFATTGTITIKKDGNVPVGYSFGVGATVVNLSDANGLGYAPATPGNWTSPPALVGTALDDLAASVASSATPATRTSTTSTSITTADRFLDMNSSSATTVTLPAATSAGQVYTITNINTGVATVSGANLINGQSSITLNNGDSMSIVSIAGVWNIW
jgi:hypothetical protein